MRDLPPAADLEHLPQNGWVVSWHPPGAPPPGRAFGANGVCVTEAGEVVLISHDGEHWGLPGGRPEGAETLRETLDREMREEACVRVVSARLLGYLRSRCADDCHVRSFWRAEVAVDPWEPEFEVPHRRIVPVGDAPAALRKLDETGIRVTLRALTEAFGRPISYGSYRVY